MVDDIVGLLAYVADILARPKFLLYAAGVAMAVIATGLLSLWIWSKANGAPWDLVDLLFGLMIAAVAGFAIVVLSLARRTENV